MTDNPWLKILDDFLMSEEIDLDEKRMPIQTGMMKELHELIDAGSASSSQDSVSRAEDYVQQQLVTKRTLFQIPETQKKICRGFYPVEVQVVSKPSQNNGALLSCRPLIPLKTGQLPPILSYEDSNSYIICPNRESVLQVSSPASVNSSFQNDAKLIIARKEGNKISYNAQKVVYVDEDSDSTIHCTTSEICTESSWSRQSVFTEAECTCLPVNLREQLVACARVVEGRDHRAFHEIVKELSDKVSPEGDWCQRVGYYLLQALKVKKEGSQKGSELHRNLPSAIEMFKAYQVLFEKTPYVMIPHYFATRMILEACEGERRVHIVDFGILYGIQWEALIQELANRPEGPKMLRITGISFPKPQMKAGEGTALADSTAGRLKEFARERGVSLEYRPVRGKSWEDISVKALLLKPDEVLIVNCLFRLRHLPDKSVCPESARNRILKKIRDMNPKVFIEGELNANLNGECMKFVDRFTKTLEHSSKTFEAIDACIPRDNIERMHIERQFLGNAICNIVACEGAERVERAELYKTWENLTREAGFQKMPIDSSLTERIKCLMKDSFHPNYGVTQYDDWILLGWKQEPTHAICAWRLSLPIPHPTAASISVK